MDDLFVMRMLLSEKEQRMLAGLKRLGTEKIVDVKTEEVMKRYNEVADKSGGDFPHAFDDDLVAFGGAYNFYMFGHPKGKAGMGDWNEERAEEKKRGLKNMALHGVDWKNE